MTTLLVHSNHSRIVRTICAGRRVDSCNVHFPFLHLDLPYLQRHTCWLSFVAASLLDTFLLLLVCRASPQHSVASFVRIRPAPLALLWFALLYPLLLFASSNGHANLCLELVKREAVVSAINASNYTPLHWAAYKVRAISVLRDACQDKNRFAEGLLMSGFYVLHPVRVWFCLQILDLQPVCGLVL